MARRTIDGNWTRGVRGRGRARPQVVATSSLPRLVTSVAFDQFVLDDRALLRADGASLARGVVPGGATIAVGSAPWPGMPIDWIALQSRRSVDLLALAGDEMNPVGHRLFDDRFAVDADEVSRFRKLFRTSLRVWLSEFDDAHGPLIVIFDGGDGSTTPPPRRRATDTPADPSAADDDPSSVPTVFVARVVTDDAAVLETLTLASELAEHVRSAVEL